MFYDQYGISNIWGWVFGWVFVWDRNDQMVSEEGSMIRKFWSYVNRDTPYGALIGTVLGLPLGWLMFWGAVKVFNL